jgi:lipopolysaccharide transport system permease protein
MSRDSSGNGDGRGDRVRMPPNDERALETDLPRIANGASHGRARQVVRRQASPSWVAINLAELWQYRELLLFQAARDIKVRYKQTLLGAGWAILQPVLTMVVFSIVFGRLAGVSSEGVPYPVFAFAALLPWQLFAYALTHSSNSLLENPELLTKVYFPRLIMPLASVLAGLVDFAIAFAVLVLMMLSYGIVPGWAILTLPLFIALAIAAALSVGLWLSALNVKYRDVRYTIPFLAQIWMLASPVGYSAAEIPPEWQGLFGINPMVSVIEGFRWALLGRSSSPGPMLAASAAATAFLLIGGLFYFRRMEKSFADIV